MIRELKSRRYHRIIRYLDSFFTFAFQSSECSSYCFLFWFSTTPMMRSHAPEIKKAKESTMATEAT